MSLEYLLLTFIALNGSRMWINSARERVLTRFPASGGDVNGRAVLRSDGSLVRYRAGTPSG
jgi:hypothetical protein